MTPAQTISTHGSGGLAAYMMPTAAPLYPQQREAQNSTPRAQV
jgi:hypothetical protein